MKNNFLPKMTFVVQVTFFAALSSLICFSACRPKEGDPAKFSVISFDDLTEKNTPKGVLVRNGEVRLENGYEIVHSADSTKALIRMAGESGGTTAMRCDCDGALKVGCIVTLEGIITCKPVLCTACKPVLQVYDGLVSVDRFRK